MQLLKFLAAKAHFSFNLQLLNGSFVLSRYILGIESPLVCDILPLADDQYGLMDVTEDQFHSQQQQPQEGSYNVEPRSIFMSILLITNELALQFGLTNLAHELVAKQRS